MKKLTKTISIMLFVLFTGQFISSITFASVPLGMSYQVVIRNSTNQLVVNQQVRVKFSILKGSATGVVVYKDSTVTTTNANGLVNISLGGAGFNSIDWSSGIYFIRTETDPTGGTNYTITGTSQLLSVPYAFYSAKSDIAVFADSAKLAHLSDLAKIAIFADSARIAHNADKAKKSDSALYSNLSKQVVYGGFNNMMIFDNPGTYSFIAPKEANYMIEVWGGGGGGGSHSGARCFIIQNENESGSGGGAGGYAKAIVHLLNGSSYTVQVGEGGLGNSFGNGGDGGMSNFGSFVGAYGGSGGLGQCSNNICFSSGGDPVFEGVFGIQGGAGSRYNGGNSPNGGSGGVPAGLGGASDGKDPGGGGSTHCVVGSCGNGGNGMVVIWW